MDNDDIHITGRMNSRLANYIYTQLAKRLEINHVNMGNILTENFPVEVYRYVVPKEVEEELLAFKHQNFLHIADGLSLNITYPGKRSQQYMRIKFRKSRPVPRESPLVQFDENDALYIAAKAIFDARNSNQIAELQIRRCLAEMINAAPDHRALFHVWPNIAKYVKLGPYAAERGRSVSRSEWPSKQTKKQKRFVLTDEWMSALTQYTLLVKDS